MDESPTGTSRPCRHAVRLLACLTCFLGLPDAPVAGADAPKIDRIFPLGGQQGGTVSLSLAGKPGPGLSGWSDCAGITFAFSEKGDKATLTIADTAPPGLHVLRFANAEGSSKLFPFVVGRLPEVTEAEPNDRISDAQPIADGAVANGVLSKSGEVDVYRVPLKRGQRFVASLNGHRLGSPMDAVLQLLDGRGTVLTQNDEFYGFDPQIVFDVPADGDYFVRTFAFPATPNSSIRFSGAATYAYRLTVTTGPFVSHTLPLVVGSSGSHLPQLVGWNLQPNPKSEVTEAGLLSGVRIESSAANGLLLETVAMPSVIEARSGEPLQLPFVMSGTIAKAGETDQVRIAAKKGPLAVRVAAQSLFSELDPVVAIRDAKGKLVREFDDINRNDRDVRASVALPADGEYSVEIRDRFGHAGRRYFYSLTCGAPAPDFRVTATADAFVVVAGQSVDIPLTITRENGFAEEIVVEPVGLPAGVTCPAVTSSAKGETAKQVTLRVNAGAEVTGGFPFSIRCRAGDRTRAVTRGLTELRLSVSSFWLTVRAAAK